jgi:NADH-ubiquinone oxidoreductase chain 5
LIARSSAIFEFAPTALTVITISGACTAFFAATTGLLQNDLKKVIAYSTCSQLGYMIFACGLSNYSVGIFHLSNHAFFKALLFLSAGSVIHAVSDEQDMRKMGGLKKLIPFTYSIMLIGSLALMGFPFLTGFYSKDVILEVAYGKFNTSGHFSYLLGTIGAFLTAFYSMRLLYLTFLSKPNIFKSVIFSAKESSYQINFSLLVLTIPSIFIGFYAKDMFIGLGTNFWGNSIFVLPENMNRIDAEFICQTYKLLPVILSITGASLAFIFYTFGKNFLFKLKVSRLGKKFYNFLNKKWFFDKIINEHITQNFLKFGYRVCYKIIDRGIIEVLGPLGLTKIVLKKSKYLYYFQSGHIFHYTLLFLISSTVLLSIRQISNIFFIYPDYRSFFLFFILSSVLYYQKSGV